MFAELEDNRRRISAFTPNEPRHFCYTEASICPSTLGT